MMDAFAMAYADEQVLCRVEWSRCFNGLTCRNGTPQELQKPSSSGLKLFPTNFSQESSCHSNDECCSYSAEE